VNGKWAMVNGEWPAEISAGYLLLKKDLRFALSIKRFALSVLC
jgi:hypothetical protein